MSSVPVQRPVFFGSNDNLTNFTSASHLWVDFLTLGSYELFRRFLEPGVSINRLDANTVEATNTLNFQSRYILLTQKLNHTRYCNKLLESINEKIKVGAVILGAVETAPMRKERILKKYPSPLNRLAYFTDSLYHRVLPKLSPLTAKMYFGLTKGRDRVFPKAELLGRLYACGFAIKEILEENGLLFFVAEKKQCPFYNKKPSYGLIFKMRRVGKNGRIIHVFKLRTMHAYSEYLQEYISKQNGLEKGGKFRNDFRVTSWGKVLRKWWIDEIPMLLNLLRGDLKLIGVRPISRQYYMLYREEIRDLRIKHKPGLIPPFYADLPKSLDDIMESEKRYIKLYEQNPLQTDISYLKKALRNIVVKRKTSQ